MRKRLHDPRNIARVSEPRVTWEFPSSFARVLRMPPTVLIIEDEPDVRRGLRTILSAEGFEVDEATNGRDGLECLRASPPDLAIVDLMIPGIDGYQVCREARASGLRVPILILSARSTEVDKVLGFELGADDYVTKPFGVRELLCRVKALLRRGGGGGIETTDVLRLGEATIDLERADVLRSGERHELFHFELEILKVLSRRAGKVVPRSELLDEVWGRDSYPTTRTVDFHVCNLRKKIESDASKPRFLQTAHGVGYRLVTGDAPSA